MNLYQHVPEVLSLVKKRAEHDWRPALEFVRRQKVDNRFVKHVHSRRWLKVLLL